MTREERENEIRKQLIPTKEECLVFFKELTKLVDVRFVPYYKVAVKALEQESVIDKIREEWTEIVKKNNWGSPAIYVHSGYRSEAVNKAIGGSKTSEHMLGYAVDFEPVNQKNLEFFNFMVDYLKRNNIPFSQLINEKPICGVPSWIHFSINGKKGYRKQIFKCSCSF